MARPREFDEAEVLDRAMLQFWRHGFDGTSVQDLEQATELGRQSLYNTFGDKRALFVAALARYDQKTEAMLAPMFAEAAGIPEIRAYVDGAIALQKRSRCSGCLVIRSALELGSEDREIRAAIHSVGKRVRAALANALGRAIDRGELRNDHTPADLADYVFTTLNGLAGLVGTGAAEMQARRVVDLMFESLGHVA
ncbi:MAG: TetR/AcrR family transcriptional regulator [Planctomycetes bacterium]|nr:TetR/AcrR family transcriptional regulator [Planctomycetota bacterium]